MVTSEEKKLLILDLMAIYDLPGKESEIQILLHNMLMRDTQKGKLYKYRDRPKICVNLHDGVE